MKEIEIKGCVTIPDEISLDEFWDKFIDWIETNKWTFGGGVQEVDMG